MDFSSEDLHCFDHWIDCQTRNRFIVSNSAWLIKYVWSTASWGDLLLCLLILMYWKYYTAI